MSVIETERLSLREISVDDAPVILELLNDPSFVRFIGDKGVRSLDEARQYITDKLVASYERFGFGLWMVELRETKEPTGICGLVKRDALEHADIGYALLPRYWFQGFARESAAAVLNYGIGTLGLKRLLAVTDQDNVASIKVLEKIGLKFERMVKLSEDGPEIKLFAYDAPTLVD
ncbi:MAG: GNAT family N-acetyltransferase [Pyrinomonadaceae bacterium]